MTVSFASSAMENTIYGHIGLFIVPYFYCRILKNSDAGISIKTDVMLGGPRCHCQGETKGVHVFIPSNSILNVSYTRAHIYSLAI
jgi:hypothetical protein